MPVPVATYAIPLALVGFVTLFATALCIFRRRQRINSPNENKPIHPSTGFYEPSLLTREMSWRTVFTALSRATTLRSTASTPTSRSATIKQSNMSQAQTTEKPNIRLPHKRRTLVDPQDPYTSIYIPSLPSQHRSRHPPTRASTREAFPPQPQPYPHPQPEQSPTRHRSKPPTVPARLFKAAPASPTIPYILPVATHHAHVEEENIDAAPNYDSVMSHYLHPSPIPPPSHFPGNTHPPALTPTITPPRPMHVRMETSGMRGLPRSSYAFANA